MSELFEYTRSVGERQLHLLYHPGQFESLPYEIRLLGPWFGRGFGPVAGLRPVYRVELAHHGYVIVSGRFGLGNDHGEWPDAAPPLKLDA